MLNFYPSWIQHSVGMRKDWCARWPLTSFSSLSIGSALANNGLIVSLVKMWYLINFSFNQHAISSYLSHSSILLLTVCLSFFHFVHSFVHPLSLTLCLSVCLTAVGSCLFDYLYYRWCNQTGQSHRPALTLADTRDRKTERQKPGQRRQEANKENSMWGRELQ